MPEMPLHFNSDAVLLLRALQLAVMAGHQIWHHRSPLHYPDSAITYARHASEHQEQCYPATAIKCTRHALVYQ